MDGGSSIRGNAMNGTAAAARGQTRGQIGDDDDRVHLLDNVCWWTGVSEVAQPTYLHNATTPAAVASYRLF